MIQAPIRHLLFFSVLLFIVLSSGSLQCALNCYDRAAGAVQTGEQVADCHPMAIDDVVFEQILTFSHRDHTDSQATTDPTLSRLAGGAALALFNVRFEAPAYRSADPVEQPLRAFNDGESPLSVSLPTSQSQKQIRATILLM